MSGNAAASFSARAVANITAAVMVKTNSPALGTPTIGGAAQVGQTLTRNSSGITDDDGMVNTSFSYQWLADNANISEATGSSITLDIERTGQDREGSRGFHGRRGPFRVRNEQCRGSSGGGGYNVRRTRRI